MGGSGGRPPSRWLVAALVFIGCASSALVFAYLNFPGVRAAILFPSYAVVTTALLVSPRRDWGILLVASAAGNFAPHLLTGPITFALSTELANGARAVLVALLVHRFAPAAAPLSSLRGGAVFLGAAVGVGPAVGAAIGAAMVVLHRDADYWLTWRAWFLSNGLTAVALLPMMWMLVAARPAWPRPARLLEAVALGVGLIGSATLVFLLPVSEALLPAGVYYPLPFLLWAALRFGSMGVSAALFALSMTTIGGAIADTGPFVAGSPSENLLQMQLFLIVVAIPLLLLSALIEQERGTAAALRTSQADSIAQRQVERALRDADQRKDEFIAMLGHELRNPLAPIGAGLELLRRKPDADERAARTKEVMDRQLRHMTRLVDDLLDVSKITQGSVRLALEPTDAVEVARQAVETVGKLVEQRKHTLILTLPDAPVTIHADGVRLTQVLVNLLNNAAKYTNPGGHIAFAMVVEDDRVVFSVRDDGIGVAPEMTDRVFQLFDRGEIHPGRSQNGLGIGLTLTRQLVKLHGGEITLRSKGRGCGTEVIVELPAPMTPPI
ncbi:MAG: hypothetical protein HOV80_20665 [Polyangiaceae bacterium]|nr:hypothetical protein [Polyangiaceae bacterium]